MIRTLAGDANQRANRSRCGSPCVSLSPTRPLYTFTTRAVSSPRAEYDGHRMTYRSLPCSLLVAITVVACVHHRTPYSTTGGALQLTKVVLYRNGVGYFERAGKVEGDEFTLRVRKDQVNDLLKSLTVVERAGGRAVSISMPLDPRAWSNAAIATLGPGSGSLAEVLDKLRGTDVTLRTTSGWVRGRILIVEQVREAGAGDGNDHGTARAGLYGHADRWGPARGRAALEGHRRHAAQRRHLDAVPAQPRRDRRRGDVPAGRRHDPARRCALPRFWS